MTNLLPKLKKGVLCIIFSFGVMSFPAMALTPAEIAAARTAAQSEGVSFGGAAQTGASATDPRTGTVSPLSSLKPETLINTGSTVGGNNVWGSQYTGTVPSSLTDKETSTSLISVGNAARGASVSGFTGYNGTRADQANQANYFLSQAPVVKPALSTTEPWLVAGQSGISTAPSSTTISKPVCPEPKVDTPATVMDNTCTESYVPYIVPCSSTGVGVSFELVPAPITTATGSYSCPASSGSTTIVLSGSMCTSTTTLVTPGTVYYSCALGETLNGISCVKTTTTTKPPTTNYGCPAGEVLSGANCVATANQSATPNYFCPIGENSGTLIGATCVYTSTYPAQKNYACSPGATLNGTSCSITTTALTTTCNIGQTYTLNMTNTSGMGGDGCQGGDAVWAQWVCTGAENPTITMYTNSKYYGSVGAVVPNDGGSAIASIDGYCTAKFMNTTTCSNGTCNGTYVMAIGVLSSTTGCTPGDTVLNANSCWHDGGTCDSCTASYSYPRSAYDLTPVFTESSFGSASRIVASGTFQTAASTTTTTSTPATLTFSCPSGQTLTGSTCTLNTTTPASIAYTCPTGFNLSGTNCSSTSTTPATQTYTCDPGFTLNGASCVQSTTSTSSANVGYTCPTGAVLSGSNCTKTTVTTVSATLSYSCPTGYTLSGTTCTGKTSDKLIETTSSGCGALEGLSN